jgi:hypothetical protein
MWGCGIQDKQKRNFNTLQETAGTRTGLVFDHKAKNGQAFKYKMDDSRNFSTTVIARDNAAEAIHSQASILSRESVVAPSLSNAELQLELFGCRFYL